MRVVVDADILSSLAKIDRLNLLSELFEEILIPKSVLSELKLGNIHLGKIKYEQVKLSREELLLLRTSNYPKMHRGEKECFVVAKSRNIPVVSNEKIVRSLCLKEKVDVLSLLEIMRFGVLRRTLSRNDVMKMIALIEQEDNTTIRRGRELFK